MCVAQPNEKKRTERIQKEKERISITPFLLWHFSTGDKIENCSAQFLAVCWTVRIEFKVHRPGDGLSVSNALLLDQSLPAFIGHNLDKIETERPGHPLTHASGGRGCTGASPFMFAPCPSPKGRPPLPCFLLLDHALAHCLQFPLPFLTHHHNAGLVVDGDATWLIPVLVRH